MKATFFPFTDISQAHLAAATAVFGSLLLYRPSRLEPAGRLQAWIDRDALEIRIPVQGDENRLRVLLQEYQQWAELHGSGDLARFKPRQGEIPFFDDQSPLKIRSEILRHSAGAKTGPDPADALFQARLFLQMAQAFDRQQRELQQALEAIDGRQQAMLRELGDFDAPPPAPSARLGPAPDPGAHMTVERLAAWAHLALQAPAPDAVLLTDSPAAWDLLADRFPATAVMAHWPVVSGLAPENAAAAGWRTELLATLDRLAQSAWPGPDPIVLPPPPAAPPPPRPFALKLALVPDTPLPMLLADLTGRPPLKAPSGWPGRQRHSLLALIA
jgi:hypothetical protein